MSFVNTVDIVGDEALSASIIDRSITELSDSIVTTIGMNAFRGCSELTKADFAGPVSTVVDWSFYECTALRTFILRSSAVCSLGDASAFTNTPIAKGTGYIYVPRALVDTYKAATNWSTYAAQFRALEDYTVDGTTTGALDWDKINAA